MHIGLILEHLYTLANARCALGKHKRKIPPKQHEEEEQKKKTDGERETCSDSFILSNAIKLA